jgi:Flp pilus assembly protein TadD
VRSEAELHRILDRSSALLSEQLYDQHELHMRQAVRRFPDDPEVLLRLALAILSPHESPQYIRRAIELGPEDPHKLTRAATMMLFVGELEGARDYARRAAKLATEDFSLAPDLVRIVGELEMRSGDDERAEVLLLAAFEAEPDGMGHGQTLAEFYADRGRLIEGLRVISETLRHRRDDEYAQRVRERILYELWTGDPGAD